jgi:hypothetical protein
MDEERALRREARAAAREARREARADRRQERKEEAKNFAEDYKEKVKQNQASQSGSAPAPYQEPVNVSPQDAWKEASRQNLANYEAAKANVKPNSLAAQRLFHEYEAAQARSWRDTGMSSLPGHASYNW